MALYPLIRPLLFALDAERAHALSLAALQALPRGAPPTPDRMLAVELAGVRFPNPLGLAAGYDKNGEAPDALLGLGFGFVEIGTLTPRAQAGNDRPRVFRLERDEAVINRLGFNNEGQGAAAVRLAKRRQAGVLGINVGANKDVADRIGDYASGVAAMSAFADYMTINISSPNTPGLRALQQGDALDTLLAGVIEARGVDGPPLFLKVAPDLEGHEIDAVARIAHHRRIDALIVGNTTLARPNLMSAAAGEAGGLSGKPLAKLAARKLAEFRTATGGALPLIAAGGVASAEDAYARILAGASLVQLYTALVYHGPGLPRRIVTGLKALLERDGFASVTEAIGESLPA